ncbi:MAG: hypothetical protein OXI81_15480 [Paracoccaceae bacterium]|nr:hypothetical protein [Paracoccaceae bacterium]
MIAAYGTSGGGIWTGRAVFVVVTAVLILLYLFSFGTPGRQPPLPDLLYCSIICVVVRRPGAAPFWLVVPVLLVADIFHMRPLGLWTLIIVGISEIARYNRAVFLNQVFVVEWLAAMAGFLLALGVQQIAMILLLVNTPPFETVFWTMITTALAYPLVVALWSGVLGFRKPHPAEVDFARDDG